MRHERVKLTSQVTEAGKIYSWGSSEYGQQGGRNKYTDWELGFQQGKMKGVRDYYYSVPREVTGSIITGKVRPISLAFFLCCHSLLQKFISVTCGSLHNVALTDSGEVYSWGWGVEGALGHGNRHFQYAPRSFLTSHHLSLSHL